MRVRLAATLLALALVPSAMAALSFRATLKAPGHTPKVNTKWYYTVRVTDLAGHPIRARLTAQIRDPLGTLHPVQFGATTKNIVNWPFKGTFRDYIIWPPSSRQATLLGGLVLRFTVVARGQRKVLLYRVKPH
jgi:hypothetical protein